MYIHLTAYNDAGDAIGSRSIDDASLNTHYWLNAVKGATRFKVVVRELDEQPSITCPQCGAVSHNPNDIRDKYCGRCHQYHDLIGLEGPLKGKVPPTPPLQDNKSLGEYFDKTPPTQETD